VDEGYVNQCLPLPLSLPRKVGAAAVLVADSRVA